MSLFNNWLVWATLGGNQAQLMLHNTMSCFRFMFGICTKCFPVACTFFKFSELFFWHLKHWLPNLLSYWFVKLINLNKLEIYVFNMHMDVKFSLKLMKIQLLFLFLFFLDPLVIVWESPTWFLQISVFTVHNCAYSNLILKYTSYFHKRELQSNFVIKVHFDYLLTRKRNVVISLW